MMFFPHDLYIGGSLAAYGEYSELEVQFLLSIVRPNDIVVDAGAHIGCLTLPLANRVGDQGRVYAFEIQRVMFQMLCGNVMLNGFMNVIPRHVALGDPVIARQMVCVQSLDYAEDGNYGDVGLVEESGDKVPLVAIDDLKLPHCRLIKADVQGMESEVLHGAKKTISRYRPFLYMEDDVGTKLARQMQELNYDVYQHYPPLFNPKNYDNNPNDVFKGPYMSLNIFGVPTELRDKVSVQLPKIV